MRKILVGQQPGNLNPPSKPLWAGHAGSTGYRIAMMAGLDVEEYHEIFERVNINHLQDYRFQVNAQTRANGVRLRGSFRADDLVIALGNDVCECLCLPVPDEYFSFKRTPKSAYVSGFLYAVIPHPSGLNRFYNERENWKLASDFLREIVAYPNEYDSAEHPWNKPEKDEEHV